MISYLLRMWNGRAHWESGSCGNSGIALTCVSSGNFWCLTPLKIISSWSWMLYGHVYGILALAKISEILRVTAGSTFPQPLLVVLVFRAGKRHSVFIIFLLIFHHDCEDKNNFLVFPVKNFKLGLSENSLRCSCANVLVMQNIPPYFINAKTQNLIFPIESRIRE